MVNALTFLHTIFLTTLDLAIDIQHESDRRRDSALVDLFVIPKFTFNLFFKLMNSSLVERSRNERANNLSLTGISVRPIFKNVPAVKNALVLCEHLGVVIHILIVNIILKIVWLS